LYFVKRDAKRKATKYLVVLEFGSLLGWKVLKHFFGFFAFSNVNTLATFMHYHMPGGTIYNKLVKTFGNINMNNCNTSSKKTHLLNI
jgi:hypothetical protein